MPLTTHFKCSIDGCDHHATLRLGMGEEADSSAWAER